MMKNKDANKKKRDNNKEKKQIMMKRNERDKVTKGQ